MNHVRSFIVRAFNRAKKADKWLEGNPAEETDTRRVSERIVVILTPDEVLSFFAGKRGGVRVYYLDLPRRGVTHLVAIFGKREKADLSAAERKIVAELVRRLKEEP